MRDLDERGVPYRYEEVKVRYDKPATSHTYTPDLILKNGIIVETKGIFDVDDRRRSEEHTSELQSLMRISYAVFCLKKKIKNLRTLHRHDTLPMYIRRST